MLTVVGAAAAQAAEQLLGSLDARAAGQQEGPSNQHVDGSPGAGRREGRKSRRVVGSSAAGRLRGGCGGLGSALDCCLVCVHATCMPTMELGVRVLAAGGSGGSGAAAAAAANGAHEKPRQQLRSWPSGLLTAVAQFPAGCSPHADGQAVGRKIEEVDGLGACGSGVRQRWKRTGGDSQSPPYAVAGSGSSGLPTAPGRLAAHHTSLPSM